MRIQFDPNQAYQLEAVMAIVDLFEGQPPAQGDLEVALTDPAGLRYSDLGLANSLALEPEEVQKNLEKVQKHNKGTLWDSTEDKIYTVEMETGTGKTYVYLRTIFELNARYGWKKFIIVVPSVAIREGVLKSIEMMAGHFRDLYGNVPFDTWIYDSAQASRLRSFATSNALQILILNIQAFDKRDINVIHQDSDRMSGYKPLDFIRSSQPILILDEPQNMTSDKRKDAISSLNPLFELRYSATHKEVVNLVYRLDPVQAYDKGLVKKIEVSAILDEPDFNQPYISAKSFNPKSFKMKLELDVQAKDGPRRKKVNVGIEEELYALTQREQYRDWIVTELDAEDQSITFGNGVRLTVGQATGANTAEVMRTQIAETIKRHFEKERKLLKLPEAERMKVLSLFFIDRVANYAPDEGKIRRWFVEEYERLSVQYKDLNPLPVEQVHNGYFAQDKQGAKDTTGNTKADDEAYQLIMRDKERLLSLEEPLRFIFSHSALREGWDNPNVFQICTLNETRSEMRKRQEIGRGLRLPVRSDGTRCFDDHLNILTVVANESYDQFAKSLQGELKADFGVEFGDRVKNARERRPVRLKKGWAQNPDFQELWERIRRKTRYNVGFEASKLIESAAAELRKSAAIRKPKISIRRGRIRIDETGVVAEQVSGAAAGEAEEPITIPDMLTYLQRQTELTRSTIAEILVRSRRLGDAFLNPQQFLNQALASIRAVLVDFLVDGIEYEKIEDMWYEQHLFEDPEIEAYANRVIDVKRSIYEELEVDSETERKFAKALDERDDIKLFFKLPRRFTVETPLGTYNPDWAIVKEEDCKLYLIRETKGTTDRTKLRIGENAKIACGERHFGTLGVDFDTVSSAEEV